MKYGNYNPVLQITEPFDRSAFVCVIALLALTSCADFRSADLPLRSECIVKIILHWPDKLSPAKREKIIDDISSAIMFSAAKGGPDVRTNAAFPKNQKNFLYLQFARDCQERLENAKGLMEYVRKIVPEAPLVSVSNEYITPGADTIDVWGPAWSREEAGLDSN